ncbi:MAG: hypothetical protein P1V20_27725 [Verrucomicrobiales bacterium]|nr:hypothetical protein [Verrucomicrobiales bacterium]
MKNLFTILPLFFGSLLMAEEPSVTAQPAADYIRYREAKTAGQPDVLETAVSRFQKGDHSIDLISVVHLGDAAYFEKLNESLKSYDIVFYEMVGGPYTEEKARLSKQAASPDDNLAQVQGLQQMAKSLLGLEFQLDGLDYLAANFVHADMTADEFSAHTEKGNGVSDLITRALKIAQSGNVKGVPATEAEANRLMSKVMGAVLTGNSNELKRSLGPILAEAESFIIQLEEEEGTVLISRRNEIVIDKIEANLSTRGPGPKTDAVLYGAGHMPDLEIRLREMGYEKSDTEWEASWVIEEGANQNPNAPNLNDMMQQLSGLMKMMNPQ